MTITQATTYAGWLAALAIVALIAMAWRRPSDASDTTNGTVADDSSPDTDTDTDLDEHAPLDLAVPWPKKLWSAAASLGLAVWVGAAVATVVGFGAAFTVITLTNMLKR